MDNPVQQARHLGQSMWLDNVARGLLTSGEMRRLIALGISGATSNPTIFEKAIDGSTDYDEALKELALGGASTVGIYEALTQADIRATADLLRPLYEETNGQDGYVSLEVNPGLAYDTEGTVAEAQRLFRALDRPNVMIKVPATTEGIPAIRRLIGSGVNVNVTLIFSLEVYREVCQAYIEGLHHLSAGGGEVARIASVASFFVSRVDTAVDRLLQERIGQGGADLQGLLGRAAVANAKLAYQRFKTIFGGERFASLLAQGPRVQRPLWASTSTKNPAYSDVMYVEPLIGPHTVNTLPPVTLQAFLDHGRVAASIEQGIGEAEELMEGLRAASIDMEQVTSDLLTEGVKLFADSFDKLLRGIEEKKARLPRR